MSRQAIVPYARPQAPRRTAHPAPAKRGKRGGSATKGMMIALLLMFLALAAGLFLPTSVLLITGMIPTFVALLVDQDPDKYAAITVAPVNFCGILPSAIALWSGENTLPQALRLLSESVNWLTMYGAAGIGWMLFFAIPPVIASVVVRRHEGEIARLTEHQEKLVEEWGAEVAGPSLQADRVA